MKYWKPSDQTNPDAPYVNANPGAGIRGSIPPAEAIEHPMREIVNVIQEAGMTPDGNDLTQLADAIRALTGAGAPGETALVHTGFDTSGSANQIIADVTPNISGYTQGHFYVIKAANAVNGPATANLDNKGARTILRQDGTAIQQGDWGPGELLYLADDGTNLRLQGIKSSFTPARNVWTRQAAGTYTFTVPAGIYWIYGEVVGGGGGGAGGGGGVSRSGGGGGSGGFAAGWLQVTPGQNITVIVGAKGVGSGNGDGSQGGTGGTSSLGAFMTATGGTGGQTGSGSAAGGSPGVGSGGQINRYGANGGDGHNGNNDVPGGQGGSSAYGGGGRTSTIDVIQADGLAPGSGGGGIWGNAGSAQQGGNGADGSVTINY